VQLRRASVRAGLAASLQPDRRRRENRLAVSHVIG
jgi:hypothetical protein